MKKLVGLVLTAFLVSIVMPIGMVNAPNAKGEIKTAFSTNLVAPNEGAIAQSLIKQGKISRTASQDVIDAAVSQYLKTKLKTTVTAADDKNARIQAAKKLALTKAGYNNIVSNRKNGVNILSEDNIAGVNTQKLPKSQTQANLLVLLADFPNDGTSGSGPLYSDFPKPSALDNATLFVQDYSTEYYKKLLFSTGGFTALDQDGKTLNMRSMRDYFREQSQGKYDINGDVYGWYTLSHPESYYGDDTADGGTDSLLPGTPKDVVQELMDKVAKDGRINLANYDKEDLYDVDGDGNYNEPDGIIDHLVIMHAGLDQSAGGGAQGDNAIWAHSSSVDYTVTTSKGNFTAMNYTIQGQDSGIGTFCHEYGHDLGLPDEYDTEYTGDGEPVGFWSIMSSGSWLGQPLDSKPSSFSAWGRYSLGWINPTVVDFSALNSAGSVYDIDQATSYGTNTPAVKVNLPDQVVRIATPFEGGNMWYGGRADEADNTVRTSLTLPAATSIKLNMQMMYDTEANWDFGFVQVSTDNGATWKSLSSARTTSTIVADGMESIKANLPGYTGNSGGWINETLDLTQYNGKTILLQYRYMTDWGTTMKGMFIDAIKIFVNGSTTPFLQDNCESVGNWISNGWTLMNGTENKAHYYLLEWRVYNGSDKTLENCYNYVDSVNGTVDWYRYEPGLVMWYRNKSFTENWVGNHPGYVYLGVVDAHPDPVIIKGKSLSTRLQIRDASFNVDPVVEKTFRIGKSNVTLPSLPAAATFSDINTYWFKSAPSAGLKLPTYGLKMNVVGHSADGTVGRIKLSK